MSHRQTARASSSVTWVISAYRARLAEPLLVDAGGVEQLVGDDRVEHPHAALVEDAHDRLLRAQLGGQALAELALACRRPSRRNSRVTWTRRR